MNDTEPTESIQQGKDGKWYFYNEVWEEYGPYETKAEAEALLEDYCYHMLEGKHCPMGEYERERAVQAVMDLFFALKNIGGQPRLKDLVKLAKRIRANGTK